MVVYVSLISKYKFSQVEQFLVKQNAKLSPTSHHVYQLSSQHRQLLDGRMLRVVKQPWLPHLCQEQLLLCQEAEVGWSISCRHFLPCLGLHQKQLSSAHSCLLACHHLLFSAWSFSTRMVTLSLAYSPGWSGDGFVYVWIPEAELTATSVARSCWGSMMGSQELPVSQMCMVFYCSAAQSSGK